MKKIMVFFAGFLLIGCSSPEPPDMTGTWEGFAASTINYTDPLSFELLQQGYLLSGTAYIINTPITQGVVCSGSRVEKDSVFIFVLFPGSAVQMYFSGIIRNDFTLITGTYTRNYGKGDMKEKFIAYKQ
jgi:hypothetical protein